MHSWDALKLVIKTVILMKIVFAVVWGLVVVHYHFGQELLGRNSPELIADVLVRHICYHKELRWKYMPCVRSKCIHLFACIGLHMMHMNCFGLACAMQEPLQLQLELPVCSNNTYNPKIAYWPVQSAAITVA